MSEPVEETHNAGWSVDWRAVGACLLPNAGAWVEGYLMRRYAQPGWWDTLKKPTWCPKKETFGRVFGPIWTGLYTGMGYASYLVWVDGGGFEGCVVPNAGSWIGAIFLRKAVRSDWYNDLKKPTWTPPRFVFAPVWTGLYTGMGYASYLVWKNGGGFEGPARLPLALYGSQLLLNWSWGPVFFGAHNIPLSVVNIGALWVNVAACGYAFYGINQTAGYLFVPYLLWMTLATALNYQIYKLNCTGKSSKE